MAAACFYTAAYAAMNVGAFAIISYLSGYNERRVELERFRRSQQTTSCWPLLRWPSFLISLIGIPFTAGFFGKFYVFTTAMHSGLWILVTIGLLNSGVAAFYYLRFLGQLYMQPLDARQEQPASPAQPAFVLGIAILVAAVFVLGIIPNRVLHLAQAGAATYFPSTAAIPAPPTILP